MYFVFGRPPADYLGRYIIKKTSFRFSIYVGYISIGKPPNGLAISNALPSINSTRMNHAALPYWLVNVPQNQWPAECPDYLVNANIKDRGILSTPDANYHRQTWPEVQQIISTTPSPSHHIAPNSRRIKPHRSFPTRAVGPAQISWV